MLVSCAYAEGDAWARRKWRRTIGESSEDDDGEYGLNGADGEDEDAIVETHFALLCVLLYNTGVAVRTLFGGF